MSHKRLIGCFPILGPSHFWKRLHSVFNVKALVDAFNQEKALVEAFSVITNLRMEIFEALVRIMSGARTE